MMTPQAALTEALRLTGGHAKLAALLDIERTAVYQWDKVPPQRAMQIEALTNGQVTARQLRPDLFSAPSPKKRRKAGAA